MKNLLLLLPLLFCSFRAKADTIDFCHVYYNNIKILDINFYRPNDLVLKLDSIQSSDSITVRYFRDTPCFDCPTKLIVENEKHHPFFSIENVGTSSPFTFSLQQLIELRKKGYEQRFEIFYTEGIPASRTNRQFVLRIKLE
jgi:hypothetical protein